MQLLCLWTQLCCPFVGRFQTSFSPISSSHKLDIRGWFPFVLQPCLDSIHIRAKWHAAMLYIKSSESIKVYSVIHDDAGWYYASSVSKKHGALRVHVQGYLYSKRLLPCRAVAMQEPHIVLEVDRCSLATGRSPFSLSSSNLSRAAGFLPPHHKNKAVAHSFGVVVGV